MRDAVLANLARAVLGDSHETAREPIALGPHILLPHQHDAVLRLTAILQQYGGALLADAVGLGKTFVALAIARAYPGVDVVAPAGLLRMWRDTSARCRMQPAPVCHSLQRFSSGAVGVRPASARRLVIIDEAHHLRNPSTHRYANVAQYCRSAHVLLLTATPVHNRASDLCNLLALFLGTRAESLSAAEQLALIVRRDASVLDEVGAHTERSATARPTLRAHPAVPLRTGDDVAVTARDIASALADLPPPVPTRDGRAAGALVALGLIRCWCSSAAACLAAVRRRRARAMALAEVLAQGRWPSQQELRTWTISEDTVQLGFTSLLVSGDTPTDKNTAAMFEQGSRSSFAEFIARARIQLEMHQRALASLESLVRRAEASLDRTRAECLRRVRSRHPGVTVIVFTQFADSVQAMGRVLRWDVGVATLTARGGRVAGGPLSRAELLRRVAPRAHGVSPPPQHERILLLITTDLLAEGVNLQDAAVVVHLDLPWTPAAIAQREGRIARLGSDHRLVHSYRIAPPGDGEALLRIAERLRRKARAASVVLAPDVPPSRSRRLVSLADVSSPTLATLRRWQRACATGEGATGEGAMGEGAPSECVVAHGRAGWLAAVKGELVGGWFANRARFRTGVSRDPRTIAALVRAVGSATDRTPGTGQRRHGSSVHDGRQRHKTSQQCSHDISHFTRAVRAALHREEQRMHRLAVVDTLRSPLARAQQQIRRTCSAVSMAERVRLAPLAATAIRAVQSLRGAGDERALEALLGPRTTTQSPEDWLQSIIALAASHESASGSDAPATLQEHASWHTLVLLLPEHIE